MFGFDPASSVNPDPSCLLVSWSLLSVSGESSERSCSLSVSESLWSLSSQVAVSIKVLVPSSSKSCPCGSSWPRLGFLSGLQNCCSWRTSFTFWWCGSSEMTKVIQEKSKYTHNCLHFHKWWSSSRSWGWWSLTQLSLGRCSYYSLHNSKVLSEMGCNTKWKKTINHRIVNVSKTQFILQLMQMNQLGPKSNREAPSVRVFEAKTTNKSQKRRKQSTMAELTVSPQNRRKGWNKNLREPEHASNVDHYSYLYSQTQSHTKLHRVYTATACCPNHCSSKPGKREERGMAFKMAVFMRWVTSCDTSHPVMRQTWNTGGGEWALWHGESP